LNCSTNGELFVAGQGDGSLSATALSGNPVIVITACRAVERFLVR
jgi:hypothetical protein